VEIHLFYVKIPFWRIYLQCGGGHFNSQKPTRVHLRWFVGKIFIIFSNHPDPQSDYNVLCVCVCACVQSSGINWKTDYKPTEGERCKLYTFVLFSRHPRNRAYASDWLVRPNRKSSIKSDGLIAKNIPSGHIPAQTTPPSHPVRLDVNIYRSSITRFCIIFTDIVCRPKCSALEICYVHGQ
jgi:hypothetical protein